MTVLSSWPVILTQRFSEKLAHSSKWILNAVLNRQSNLKVPWLEPACSTYQYLFYSNNFNFWRNWYLFVDSLCLLTYGYGRNNKCIPIKKCWWFGRHISAKILEKQFLFLSKGFWLFSGHLSALFNNSGIKNYTESQAFICDIIN
jgi:hypothetical protein